uniref:LCCL domain-containing protein n=1 Tax=Caenorhabditis tropicalis TaxID=1561998 RepID=A0A1I7TT76_9PELO
MPVTWQLKTITDQAARRMPPPRKPTCYTDVEYSFLDARCPGWEGWDVEVLTARMRVLGAVHVSYTHRSGSRGVLRFVAGHGPISSGSTGKPPDGSLWLIILELVTESTSTVATPSWSISWGTERRTCSPSRYSA